MQDDLVLGCYSDCQSLCLQSSPLSARQPSPMELSARLGYRHKSELGYYVMRDCSANLPNETDWEKSRKGKQFVGNLNFWIFYVHDCLFIARGWSQMPSNNQKKSVLPTPPPTFYLVMQITFMTENNSYFSDMSVWCQPDRFCDLEQHGGHLCLRSWPSLLVLLKFSQSESRNQL